MAMIYPAIIHKDPDSEYGVILPDFPGVFSGGASLEEALKNTLDALMTYYDGEPPVCPPRPTPMEKVIEMEDALGGEVMLIDIEVPCRPA